MARRVVWLIALAVALVAVGVGLAPNRVANVSCGSAFIPRSVAINPGNPFLRNDLDSKRSCEAQRSDRRQYSLVILGLAAVGGVGGTLILREPKTGLHPEGR